MLKTIALMCLVFVCSDAFGERHISVSGMVRAHPTLGSISNHYLPLSNKPINLISESTSTVCNTDTNGVFVNCSRVVSGVGSVIITVDTPTEWLRCDEPPTSLSKAPDGTYTLKTNCMTGDNFSVWNSATFDEEYFKVCPNGYQSPSALCKKRMVSLADNGDEYISYQDIDLYFPQPNGFGREFQYRDIPIDFVGFDEGKETSLVIKNAIDIVGQNYACNHLLDSTAHCYVTSNVNGNGKYLEIGLMPGREMVFKGYAGLKADWFGLSLSAPTLPSMAQRTIKIPLTLDAAGWPTIQSIKIYVTLKPGLAAASDPDFYLGDVDGDGIPNGQENELSSPIPGVEYSMLHHGSLFKKDNHALESVETALGKTDFLRQQFRDFLKRDPIEGLSIGNGLVDAGRGELIAKLFYSNEYQYKYGAVFGLYLAAGLEQNLTLSTEQLDIDSALAKVVPSRCVSVDECIKQSDGPLTSLANVLVDTKIFKSQYDGVSGSTFVDKIFFRNLGRNATLDEHSALNNQSKSLVLKYVVTKTNFLSLISQRAKISVLSAFKNMLKRPPTQNEYDEWTKSVVYGIRSPSDVFSSVFGGFQYANRIVGY